MAQKRVNKNLVAFLTVMGILLTVLVVGVATRQGAQKDPQFWADKAQQARDDGDLEKAMRYYNQAYRASQSADGESKDVSYLVEMAQCAYRWGDIAGSLSTLERARAEQPNHVGVLVTYLDELWDVIEPEYYTRLSAERRATMLEYAQALQQAEAGADKPHVIGPVTEAVARWAMVDRPEATAQDWAPGDAALQRACEIDQNDYRVVRARIIQERRRLVDRERQLQADGGKATDIEKLNQELRTNVVGILKAGVEAHPSEWRLIRYYADELLSSAEAARQAGKAEEGQALTEQARSVLARALEQRETDPDLHLGMARFCLREALRTRESLSPEAYAAALDKVTAEARRSIELETAMFDAWVVLAQTEITRGLKDPNTQRPAAEHYEAALRVYDQALHETVGVRSLYATMGEAARRLMYVRAFHTAYEYFLAATTPDEQTARREGMEKFLTATEVRYPEEAFTAFMRGEAAVAERQITLAIQSFERAEDLAKADAYGRYPQMWFQAFNGVLPLQELALLSREAGQLGESLRYTDEAIAAYRGRAASYFRNDAPPPLPLMVNRAELLVLLDRSQQALDFIAELRRSYASGLEADKSSRLRLATAEADSLRKLGRTKEAEEALGKTGDDLSMAFAQARLAAMQNDYAGVETRCRELLGRKDLTVEGAVSVLQLLVPALVQAGRQEQGKPILTELRERYSNNPDLERYLKQYDLILSYSNVEERDAKLLELIAEEKDANLRASRYFSFYMGRGQLEKAGEYLDELEKAHPDDVEVQRQQFMLAVRLGQFDRAAKYVVLLTKANNGRGADLAGGATFRAQLALTQGRPDEAVRELRAAREVLPRSSGLQVALAQALLAAKHLPEAIEALDEALEANPRDFDANKLMYMVDQMMPADRRPDDGGLSYLMTAAELRPNDPFIQEKMEFINEENNPKDGIAKREQRRKETPSDVANLIRLGELYANKKVGDEVRATECFQAALKIEPANATLLQTALNFYAATGRRAEGEEHLRLFMEQQKPEARGSALVVLAKFYERLGDFAAADGAYNQASEATEKGISDPERRRGALIDVGLERMEFYRRNAGHEQAMIDAARWVLDRAHADDPRDAPVRQRARLRTIQGLVAVGKYGDAQTALDSYRKDYPDDGGGLLMWAQLKLAQREWQEAYQALTAALQKLPQQVWALMNRGRLSIRYGRYVEAREDLTKARAQLQPPDDPDARERWRATREAEYTSVSLNLAELYEVTEQYELAESVLRELLKLASDKPDGAALVQQVVDRLVTLFGRTDQLDKAKQLAGEFMARFPTAAIWPYRYASVCMEEGRKLTRQADNARDQGNATDEKKFRGQATGQYETAAANFQKAQQLASTNDVGYAMRCLAFRLDALAAGGQAAKAVQEFEQWAAAGKIPAIVRAAVIRAYSTLNRPADALTQLEQALLSAAAESAGIVNAVVGFSQTFVRAEDVLSLLEKLCERTAPESLENYRLRNVLAQQMLAADRPADALRATDPVLAKAPADAPERAAALLLRAAALSKTGDANGAIALLEQLLSAFPNLPAAMNNLAYVLVDQANRPQEALQWAEKAYDQDPRNASLLDTLGWVYFKNGKYDEAEAILKQALSIEPENVAGLLHLGQLCADRGRASEARNTLRRALDLAQQKKDREYESKIKAALESLH